MFFFFKSLNRFNINKKIHFFFLKFAISYSNLTLHLNFFMKKKKKKLLPRKTQGLTVQTSAKKIPFFFFNLQFLNLILVTFKFFYEKKKPTPT